jgi:hypothetical protein
MRVQRRKILNRPLVYFMKLIGGLKLTRETPPGECGRKVKLKGIDGGLYKGWSMWFNSNNTQNLTNFCI